MGLSALPDTLPMQLMKQNVTKSTTFSLCLSNHGGALTLGGINHKLHQQYDNNGSGYNSSSSSRVDDIKYVKLMNSDSGWFTVKLLDILIVGSDGSSKSLGVDKSVYNSNKGVIIDSGTTDTYLPGKIKKVFTDAYNSMSSIKFSSSGNVLLSDSPSLPTIVFVMEGVDGKAVHVSMPPTSYIEVDRNSNDKQQQQQYGYNRIYLTEPSGAVLGANFMKHYDVIFDSQRKQVGFAKSSCSLYNDSSAISDTDSGRSIVYDRQVAIDKNVKLIFNSLANSNCSVTLTKSCSATCDFPSLAATASSTGIYTNTSISVAVTAVAGSQVWSSTCTGIKMVPCEMKCGDLANDVYIERHCPSTPWSSCSANCTQTRVVSQKNTNCTMMTESRRCSYDLCESADSRRGDVAISFDMKLSSGYITWCSYYAEQIVTGIEQVFHPLNHSVTVDLSVKRSSSSISSIDVTALLHATAPNGVDAEVLQGSMLASINHRQFPALLASCLNPPYSPNRWLSQDQLRVIGAAAVAPHSSTVSSGSIGSNGSTGGNADSIDRALLVSVLLFVAFIYSIYCWYKSCCHQLKKNKR